MTIPYIVSFNVSDTDEFKNFLSEISENYFLKLSDNFALIDSDLTAQQIFDEGHNKFAKEGDKFLISELTRNVQGWLSSDDWKIIDDKIF